MLTLTPEDIGNIMKPLVLDAVGRICHRSSAEREPEFVRETLWATLGAIAQLTLESGGHQRGRGLNRGDEQKLQKILAKLESDAPGWEPRDSSILADRIISQVMRNFPKRVDPAL